MIISPISEKALDEARILAYKALDGSGRPRDTSASILRKLRNMGDMGGVWGLLDPEHQFKFIENLKAVQPRTPKDAKPYIEIAAWIRRYAIGLASSAWPEWDNSEE